MTLSEYVVEPHSTAPSPGEEAVWPPKAQLGKTEVLLSDAVGEPDKDSDAKFRGGAKAASNHADGMVNAVRNDLSLFRRSAKAWIDGRR